MVGSMVWYHPSIAFDSFECVLFFLFIFFFFGGGGAGVYMCGQQYAYAQTNPTKMTQTWGNFDPLPLLWHHLF